MDEIKDLVTRACSHPNVKSVAHQISQWFHANAKTSIYALLAAITILWALFALYSRFKPRNVLSRSRSPDLEKPQPVRTDSGNGFKSKFAMEKPGGAVP